ncbi:DUF4056 domain-containing protein [Ferrimonas gelatinilytica]|uniref:DUF4056 domain-containing protein n=1 Tax=Ferrimonas gelatinilytica TaxID=1255257 RepID=A0ABP9S3U8_9GAMM
MQKRPLFSLFFILFISGCSSVAWQSHPRPDDATIARALNGNNPAIELWDLPMESLPGFPVPQSVRPCCAFGNKQKVKVGAVPIPLFRLGNTLSPNEVGPHKFDAGTFAHTSRKMSGNDNRGSENNGVIYTTRGGFIDLAHVRDTADDTVALFFEIIRHLGEDRIIEVPDELGRRYIRLNATDVSELTTKERWNLAADLAARLAYFKAESHEIAQWHGYASFAGWPETVSAFSPEDLYSNMLGAKLARALIGADLVLSSELYNQNMTAWLDATLEWLGAVRESQSRDLFTVVDGRWWDSSRPIPDKFMVLLRHYDLGDRQLPHIVPSEWIMESELKKSLLPLVEDLQPPHPLSLPSHYGDYELDSMGELVLEVDDKYRDSFGVIPVDLWKQGFTQLQFAEIAAWCEKEDVRQLAKLEQE